MTSVLVRQDGRLDRRKRTRVTHRGKSAKMEADMGAMWPQAEEAKEWAGHQNQEEARTGCPLNPLDGVGPSGPQNHEVVNVCYF